MASTRTLSVVIAGDAKGAKDAFKDVEAAAGGIQGKLASLSTGMKDWGDSAVRLGKSISMNISLPIAALGAVAFKELAESQKVAAQTNAVLASTGGAANVTAAQVDKLATSLMKKSGIDDEAIKSGENLLLTFTKIRNEAGRGNDVFNRATKAALDLSVAFGTDLHSASLMVGKALNDPIAGLTALGRAGVQFTAGQKEMIKKLVESGDIMSAQKIILKELETQVGGSAKAYGETLPGQIGRAKEALMNSSALILAAAAPAFEHLASAAGKVAQFLAGLPGPAREAVAAMAGLAVVAGPITLIAGKLAQGASLIVTGFGAIAGAAQTLAIKTMYAMDALKAMSSAQLIGMGAMGLVIGGLAILSSMLVMGRGKYEEISEASKKWAETQSRNAVIINGESNAYKSLQQTQSVLRQKYEEGIAAIKTIRASHEANTITSEQARIAEERLSSETTKYKTRLDELAPMLEDAKQKHQELKLAEEQRTLSLQDVANATGDITNATDDAINAMRDLQSTILAMSGGQIGYQQSLIAQEKAQRDLNDAVAQYGPDSEQARIAALNLDQANLQVASSAISLTDTTDTLKKLVADPAAYNAEIARLKMIQEQNPLAADAIQLEINKLVWLHAEISNMPESKSTKVNADTADAEANLHRVLGLFAQLVPTTNTYVPPLLRPPEGAEGAIVSRPTIALIGEAGPEAVVPLNRMPGSAPLPSGNLGAAGGMLITIPITLDGKVVTEVVVSNLNRAGGPKILQRAVI